MSSSERIIGTWMRMRGCRDEITLCTKVSTGGSGDNVARALRGSLERLQTDHVDILKMHYPDTTVPVAETLGALSAEADAGRIGAIGVATTRRISSGRRWRPAPRTAIAASRSSSPTTTSSRPTRSGTCFPCAFRRRLR